MIEILRGDLLTSDGHALVVPVNCEGVIGSGLGLAVQLRYPGVLGDYTARCGREAIRLGQVSLFRHPERPIVYFPAKERWRGRSHLDVIDDGLRSLRRLVECERVRSIALPALGCGRGGLRWGDVRPRVLYALGGLARVRVELYQPLPPAWAASTVRQGPVQARG